jgi:ureidoacrylate peracid hydrolase
VNFTDLVAPERTAVLVIDMQNDFVHDDGAGARVGYVVTHTQKILEPMNEFLRHTRAAGVKVILLKQVAAYHTTSEARRVRGEALGWAPTSMCGVGTWGAQLHGALEVADSDIVVEKRRYSAFIATDVDLILRANRIETVVVCGTDGSVCVESTARDAYMFDYHVVVPTDLVGYGRAHLRAPSLEVISTWFGTTCESMEILDVWGATARGLDGATGVDGQASAATTAGWIAGSPALT